MDISPQNDRNKCQSVENKNIYFNKSLTNLNSKYNIEKNTIENNPQTNQVI